MIWQDSEQYADEEVCVAAVAVPRGCGCSRPFSVAQYSLSGVFTWGALQSKTGRDRSRNLRL